jgi:demethylmenaquinone methyltransferase/2-methoxy-6-polyprenyl-1,4-benzoquinol methylase
MGMYRWSLRAFPEIIDCRPIRLKQVIKSAGFFIEREELFSLWSLPVEIVLARKKR